MEWDSPAIVLDVRPFGEGDAIATVLTEAQGAHAGLARGGAARGRAATWQPGNLVQVRWVGRLAEQLGSFSGELVHPGAALAMEDPIALAMLASACAVAAAALPEREPHPAVFSGLLRLIAELPQGASAMPSLVHWEALLLAELGYGLDLTRCAVLDTGDALAFVSPRTGRAVSVAAAEGWQARLLRLPGFLLDDVASGPADWRDGLSLTGHFLARDVFGVHNRPLPLPRLLLYDRVAELATPTESQ